MLSMRHWDGSVAVIIWSVDSDAEVDFEFVYDDLLPFLRILSSR